MVNEKKEDNGNKLQQHMQLWISHQWRVKLLSIQSPLPYFQIGIMTLHFHYSCIIDMSLLLW